MDLKNYEVSTHQLEKSLQELLKEYQNISAGEAVANKPSGTTSAVDGTGSNMEHGTNSPSPFGKLWPWPWPDWLYPSYASAVLHVLLNRPPVYKAKVLAAESNAKCGSLPDDVWLHIFSYLPLMSLFSAEDVCERWKDLVNVHLKTRRELTIEYTRQNLLLHSDGIQTLYRHHHTKSKISVLIRCGLNLRKVTIRDANKYYKRGNLVKMIGERCPNLVELSILGETVVNDDGLRHLALNCNKLQYLDIHSKKYLADEGFGLLLQSLNQLKRLSITCPELNSGNCIAGLNRIGPMIEDLELKNLTHLPESLFLDLSAKLKNLRKLGFHFRRTYDELVLDGFAEACANLKELTVSHARMDEEMLCEISQMLCLETLDMSFISEMDDDGVELLFHGCPNLRAFRLSENLGSRVSDAGIKYIVDHCPHLIDLDISANYEVTDSSLACVAEYGIIRRLGVRGCLSITNTGCIDLVTRCPQLELLDIRSCSNVTDAILLPILIAVQSRRDKQPLKLMVDGTEIVKVRLNGIDQSCLIVELPDPQEKSRRHWSDFYLPYQNKMHPVCNPDAYKTRSTS